MFFMANNVKYCKIQSTGTDSFEQTVQTQISLLIKEWSSAPDKEGYKGKFRDNFLYYSFQEYVKNPLAETVLMRGHNMFSLRNKKNYL